ncbi:MAG TPA: VWA domain-containing protein [Candidatus Udaeobacter sp.]|nr:VWA domain-containing protein [Candidatus Udaeobacter sp.]
MIRLGCAMGAVYLATALQIGIAFAQNNSPAPSGTAPAELHAAFSHAAYTNGMPRPLLLKVDYNVTATNVSPERPPLNIALVLDRSGSMAEARKLPFTVEAAREVIQNMSERDVLSIVAFSDRAVVLSPAGRVVNKAFLLHRLDEVTPGGYTDISAGLLEGIAQIDSQRADGQVQHVLLLTDGIANRGVTTPDGLSKLVAKADARGIGFSTFGCGTEFNEKRLAEMANAGGGRYTYVKDPEQIPTAFVEELHGLLEVAAQNATIEASVSGGQITKIYGQPIEGPVASYKFDIGNLRTGERGTIVMEVTPARFENDAVVESELRFSCDNPKSASRFMQIVTTRATFVADAEPALLGENPEVALYANVLDALEQAELAAKGLDDEQARQAHASFDQLYEQAHQRALATNDQELLNDTFLLKHFMEELAEAEKQRLLHSHTEAQRKLAKEGQYHEYLLRHHRPSQFHK